jgi:hypothetical protein
MRGRRGRHHPSPAARLGAAALGAMATGALAIKHVAIGRMRVRRLEIDELVVRRLRVLEELSPPPCDKGEGSQSPSNSAVDR